jgi:hypothetical protein
MRLSFCLRVRAFTSPPIGQALAADAAQGFVGAHRIVHAKAGTVGIAEIELGKVADEVGFGHVNECAVDPALQDREVVFGGNPVTGPTVLYTGISGSGVNLGDVVPTPSHRRTRR